MRARKKASERSTQPWIPAALAVLLAAALVGAVLWRASQPERPAAVAPHSSGAGSWTAVAPADWALPDDLPPLPVPKAPLPRAAHAVRAAYEFAARQPDVLEQLPCFCGCRKLGHRSNRDCFVAARDAAGRVTWDAHGMG